MRSVLKTYNCGIVLFAALFSHGYDEHVEDLLQTAVSPDEQGDCAVGSVVGE